MVDTEKTVEQRKQEVVDLLKAVFNIQPIKYASINRRIIFEDKALEKLLALEKSDDRLGITAIKMKGHAELGTGISVLSMIATITSILVDDRLAFCIDDDDIIVGFNWMSQWDHNSKGQSAVGA